MSGIRAQMKVMNFRMHWAVLVSIFILQLQSEAEGRCNTLNPTCGLSASEAQVRFLTPYTDLVATLKRLSRRSKVPIVVGPLIKNGDNGGIVDIDLPLDLSLAPIVDKDVCGKATARPSIREAVVCTVTEDKVAQPARGNTNPESIGFSTQGRELYAVRMGNRNGTKVFIVTQQHGNECGSTEAAVMILKKLVRGSKSSRKLLSKLDLLFVVRANPDGSEPGAENNPMLGVKFEASEGFFYHNVDPKAGGGFELPTEPGFNGVVGRGYDMNAYNFVGLRAAIRPVESQAMVSALLSFRPEFVFDMHGDLPKVLCELDQKSFAPNVVQGVFPSVECKGPSLAVPTVLSQRRSAVLGGFFALDASLLSGEGVERFKSGPLFRQQTRLVRSIVAKTIAKVDPLVKGVFTRYSMAQSEEPGTGETSSGTMSEAATRLGGIGSGWEVLNFAPSLRPAVVSVIKKNGRMEPAIGVDNHFIEPCFLEDNICIHELVLRKVLFVTARLMKKTLLGDSGYCAIPLDSGLLGRFPAALGWGDTAIEDTIMVPGGGEFGVPAIIAGTCAGDLPVA